MQLARETMNHVLLRRLAEEAGVSSFHAEQPDGTFAAVEPSRARRNTLAYAAALLRRGCGPGTAVAILGEVRTEWVDCDLGNLLARCVTIGVYPTSTPDQIAYILQHSGTRVLVVGGQADLDRCAPLFMQCPDLQLLVTMDEGLTLPASRPEAIALEALRVEGDAALRDGDAWLLEHAGAAEPDDMITLVYTSGTTGPPKGAILTHRNLFHVTDAVAGIMGFRHGQVGLVYLPLAHILQRYAVYQGLRFGGTGYCTKRMTELGEVLQQTRPQVLAAVPRVLEKIHARALASRDLLPPRRQAVFDWAFAVGLRVSAARRGGATVPLWDRIQHAIADRLVFRRVREKLGGRVEFIVSGGAPLAIELSEWFHAAGLLVIEGYGLTETSAPATTNTPSAFRFGTVGRAIPGAEVRIASDGEIEVRGPGVFRGYWKDEEATRAAFTEDGWFRTGDIGELDADRFLRITDRKKDLIITAAGKNIAPAAVENLLKQHRLIGQAMLHGDRRSYLTCLLTLCEEEAPLWAAERGKGDRSLAALARDPEVLAQVAAHVAAVNAQVARYESARKWSLLPVAFTVDSGYLTPTLKLKRRRITEDFRAELDALYAGGPSD